MDRRSLYSEAIERRRALSFDGYVTLTDVGFDGPWVSPIQKISNNLEVEDPIASGSLPSIPDNNFVSRAVLITDKSIPEIKICEIS